MAIAVYVRVSTIGQNVEGQRREIQRWLDGNGITDAEWFIDKASGATMQRDAFDRLQAGIFAGQVQTVVVWRLDRLSRSLRDGVNILGEWCERGVRVVSVTQQLDLSGALGRTLAALMLGLAEMEREAIRERQAAGIAAAKDQGIYKGRKAGTTKANPRRAAELRARGLTDAEIAASLGVSRRSVQRYLRRA